MTLWKKSYGMQQLLAVLAIALVLREIWLMFFFLFFYFSIGTIRYVGRLFVKSTGKPVEILTKLNEMAGFAPNEEIELYEVSFH